MSKIRQTATKFLMYLLLMGVVIGIIVKGKIQDIKDQFK